MKKIKTNSILSQLEKKAAAKEENPSITLTWMTSTTKDSRALPQIKAATTTSSTKKASPINRAT
jgi:hypothetical protein